ncbi:MAG: Rv3235 family protein [Actinomycetota bacterium]|nr:Rv3235 family protein [Actinomycetota bacterium]
MKHIPLQRTSSPTTGIARVTRLSTSTTEREEVPFAITQGTLALDLDRHPGLPQTPELRVVAGGGGRIDAWAARFAQAVIEVIGGDRNPHQLLRCTAPRVYADLLRRCAALNQVASPDQRRRRLRAQVRSVHVFQPTPVSAEVSVHVRHGERSRALAARVEKLEGRWVCTAIEFG